MIEFLAQATTAPAGGADSSAYNMLHVWGPLIFICLMMYVVLLLPKRRQDKQRKQMLNEMKRGDEVQTIGGIIGKVVDPREDRVLVKVDESSNTKIWFSRSAIASVTAEDAKDAKAAATTK
ncbi:MAG TPA: preprotein translocase subunit YajC [Tepidisphaeraceae bacterium]